MTPTSEATLTTSRPDRYLSQLADHAAAMADGRGHRMRRHGGDTGNPLATGEVRLSVDRTADHIVLRFDPWGTCTVRVEGDLLTFRISAADDAALRRIQQILTRDIERFGRRDHLTLIWQGVDPRPEAARAPARPARRTRIALAGGGVAVALLVIGLHLGLGGTVVAVAGRPGWTAAGIAALVAVPLLVGHAGVPLAVLRLRRRLCRGRDGG